MRRPFLSLVLLALFGLLLAGGLACGKKSTQPKSTNSTVLPLSDGTWRMTATLTATAGDASCAEANGTFVDTVQVVGGETDFFGTNCSYVVAGNNFSQACRETIAVATDCNLIIAMSGTGSRTSTSFSISGTYTTTSVPAACSPYLTSCTFHYAVTGTRIATITTAPVVVGISGALDRIERRLLPTRRLASP
jgi:hypothetical protein